MDKDILMQLLIMQNPQIAPLLELMNGPGAEPEKPKKRKVSAYSRRYGAAYKRLRKMAHKEAKRGGKR